MNNPFKLAIVAAVAVVVAIVGINLLPTGGGIGGTGPSPTVAPTSTPTSSPSASSSPSPSPAAISGWPAACRPL